MKKTLIILVLFFSSSVVAEEFVGFFDVDIYHSVYRLEVLDKKENINAELPSISYQINPTYRNDNFDIYIVETGIEDNEGGLVVRLSAYGASDNFEECKILIKEIGEHLKYKYGKTFEDSTYKELGGGRSYYFYSFVNKTKFMGLGCSRALKKDFSLNHDFEFYEKIGKPEVVIHLYYQINNLSEYLLKGKEGLKLKTKKTIQGSDLTGF